MSPSRSSQASWTPVLAPLGTAARPNEPSARVDVDLDGRIAAAVEDLPGVDVNNRGTHGPARPSLKAAVSLPQQRPFCPIPRRLPRSPRRGRWRRQASLIAPRQPPARKATMSDWHSPRRPQAVSLPPIPASQPGMTESIPAMTSLRQFRSRRDRPLSRCRRTFRASSRAGGCAIGSNWPGERCGVVSEAVSAGLRPAHGRAAQRRLRRRPARDPRSARPEVLPQPCALRLGPGRRSVRLARSACRLPAGGWPNCN